MTSSTALKNRDIKISFVFEIVSAYIFIKSNITKLKITSDRMSTESVRNFHAAF